MAGFWNKMWDYPVTLTGLTVGVVGYCIPPVYAAATSFVAANPVLLFAAGSVSLLVYADLKCRSKPEESVLRSMFSKQESPGSCNEKSDSQGTAQESPGSCNKKSDSQGTATDVSAQLIKTLQDENDAKEVAIQSLRRSNEALTVALKSGAQVDGMAAYIDQAVQKATQQTVKRELEKMRLDQSAAAGVAPSQ